MKKFTFSFKSLLVACGLLIGSANAWAQTTVTYDFTSYTAKTLTKSSTSGFKANSTEHYYASNFDEVHNRFGFQFAGSFSIEAAGLYAQRDKGDHVGICGLASGDKVTINFSQGAIMVRGNITNWTGNTSDWTSYTTGTEIPINAAGNLSFQAKTSCKISSIVITTNATESVTAPSIDSEANGSKRTVTITDGASNLLAPVTTYYTTDGTDPTASSTKYTAPFDVDATCTVKAITISTSSAKTASTITSQLIDMDAVDVPTAAITAVDGVNRTVTFSCTTDGADLYYSTDNGETYTAGTSLVISANTNIKVKATKGSASAETENIAFEAGTEIQLNAPAYTTGAYSDGKYTLTLTSNQTDKLLTPVAVVKYSVNDGEPQTINSGETVEAAVGSTYKFWSYASGYAKSNDVVVTPTYIDLSTYRTDWSMDLDALAMAIATESNSSASVTKSGEELVSGYYSITNDGFNAKFGVNDVNWQVRNYGSGKSYNTGLWPYNVNGSMVITELSAGDVIVFTGDAVTSGTNVTKDAFISTANNNSTFVVTAAGNATFTPTKSGYIHSLTVYTQRPVSVSKTITSAGWATYCSPYILDFSSSIENLTQAYIVTGNTGTALTLTEVNGKVPANTGLLLKGEGVCAIPVAATSDVDVSANILHGVTSNTNIDANTGYVLMNGTSGVGFYNNAKAFTVGANTAYLLASELSALSVKAFSLDGAATGIAEISDGDSLKADDDAVLYNTAGQQVSKGYKGIVIKNGKKYINK